LFFFIAGIQDRTTRLDEPVRTCPQCGHSELYSERWDRYFSLFFIPLFRVRKGIHVFSCEYCGSVFNERGIPFEQKTVKQVYIEPRKCPDCGRFLHDDFDYCPRCGKKIRRS
jgi:RNA polymerase subunit RPABC4/transcription elongation factor Spt4